MDRLSVVVAAMVVAMAVAVTVVLVGDGTPAARIEEDHEWTLRLREAEAALAAGAAQVTMRRLRAAHRAALRTGRWDAMVEVGDAARRAGEADATLPRAIPTASRAYLAGLARAREQQLAGRSAPRGRGVCRARRSRDGRVLHRRGRRARGARRWRRAPGAGAGVLGALPRVARLPSESGEWIARIERAASSAQGAPADCRRRRRGPSARRRARARAGPVRPGRTAPTTAMAAR